MAGIADVAARAGVSKATASRALSGSGYASEAARARVRAAADELGYVPSTSAVSLATGRTQNVGVVMPYVNRWFFAEVLEGIQAKLLHEGFDLTLYDARPGTAGRQRVFEDFLARKRFDGLIAVGLDADADEIARLMALGKPVVRVIGSGHGTSVVTIDDHDAARRATEHLLTLGHRRIAFLGSGGSATSAPVENARLAGYDAAMRAAGFSDAIAHTRCAMSLPEGYAAAVELLSHPRSRPTGIVAACDEVAIGAIVAARRLGIRVPADLSVMGIDDHEYAEMFSLTTLRQVPRDQGTTAVELLLERIASPELEPVEVRMQPRLVVRSSTAPPEGESAVAERDAAEMA